MKSLLDDLRYGFRLLWASPGYAAVAILTLATGIAVSLTVFTWVDGLLIHPIPGASDQSRLAAIENAQPNGEYQATSYRDYRDFRDQMTTVSGLASTMQAAFNLGEGSPDTDTGAGADAGIVAALPVARVASAFLFGVSAAYPAVYIGSAVFLALVTAPASYLPARRAL
jgi:hypothetical protein